MCKGIYNWEMLMSTERCSLRMIYCGVHLMKICINYKWTENITEVTSKTQKISFIGFTSYKIG